MSNNKRHTWSTILLPAVFILASTQASLFTSNQIKCSGIKLEPLGCYADKQKDRPLPYLALTYRDKKSDKYAGDGIKWRKFDSFLKTITCSCAEKVLKHGYSVMGLQNYGECWTGPKENSYSKDGPSRYCINWKYKRCQKGREYCIGEDETNFVYRVQKDKPAPTAKPTGRRTTRRTTTPTPSQTPSPSPSPTLSPTPSRTPSPTPSPTHKPPSPSPFPTTPGTWPTTPGMSSPKPSGFGTSTAKRPPSPTKFPIPCYNPSNTPCSTPRMPCVPPCQPLIDPALLMRYPGPSALGFPKSMGQYQQPSSCGPSCSSQCAPKCKSGCCRTFGSPVSPMQLPIGYSTQIGFQHSAKPGCKYGCPSSCAPRCSAKCCRLGGAQAFPGQFPMNYALGIPQGGFQSPLRAQGQCSQGCSSQCAPRCSIECCRNLQQSFPAQPVLSALSALNYQARSLQSNNCRQGCPAKCQPRCLPGCCRWFGGLYKRTAILKHNVPSLDDR